jgi:hypothetical protein
MFKILITSPPSCFPPYWIRKYWVGKKIPLENQSKSIDQQAGFSIDPKTGKIPPKSQLIVCAYDALNELYSDPTVPTTVKKWFEDNKCIFTEESRGKASSRWRFDYRFCEIIEE